MDRVRGRSKLDKFQTAFDKRVADTMDRLNVPSKNDIDKINAKLNKILKALDDKPVKPAAAPKARKAVKKTSRAGASCAAPSAD